MTIVIDCNVLISAAILKDSISDRAVRKAYTNDRVIRSHVVTEEFICTLRRPKFDRYFKNEYEQELFIHLFITRAREINVGHHISVCRDPDDNRYLEPALSGKADCIITGDPDLQVLNPFEGIPIISPKEFLDRF